MSGSIWIRRRNGSVELVRDRAQLQRLASSHEIASLAMLGQGDHECCERFLPALFDALACREERCLMLLVQWRMPPVRTRRVDGPIRSFVCSWTAIMGAADDGELSVYAVLSSFLASSEPGRLWAIQFPNDVPLLRQICDPAAWPRTSADWLIPHSGSNDFLRSCLRFVRSAQMEQQGDVFVGVDDDWVAEHDDLMRAFPTCKWYHSSPQRAGPYLVKNALAEHTRARWLCFQDSDDAPCSNRLQLLTVAAAASGVSMIGSHEIRVDEITRTVHAVRFPLDVNACFSYGPHCHPLLHGTSIVDRELFIADGMFSTQQRFSMDTQFLWRWQFLRKARNIDAFLYVRRIHPSSLTSSPATQTRSLVRQQLVKEMQRAFYDVKSGAMPLEKTSLRAVPGEWEPSARVRPRAALMEPTQGT